jgi:hypothetical protein
MALGKKKKDEAVSGPESAEVVDDSLAPQEEVEAQEEAADVPSGPVEDEAPVPSDPTSEDVPSDPSEVEAFDAEAHRAADSVPHVAVAQGHKAPDHRHGHHSGEAVEAAGVVIHPPSLLADVHKAQGV